jgi:hypothetical protein
VTGSTAAARTQALSTARRRALNALAELHPAEYLVLLHTECRELGVDPPGSRSTGRPPRIGGQR